MIDNDPNRDVHGHSSLSSAPETKSTNWLPLIIGALVLLGLLFFLLRGCDRTDDEVVTPVDESTVAAPADVNTPVATTAAGEPVAYSRDVFDRTLTGTEPLPVTYALDKVTFASGSADLNAAAKAEVTDLAAALKSRSTARVSLRGFADPEGDAAANQALSEKRVTAVRQALIDGGVAANQITAAAAGETGTTAARNNRRVEITLLQR